MSKAELIHSEKDGMLTFGIRIICRDGTDHCYPDVTNYRSEALRLQSRLQTDDISALHCNDIVRDYLFELLFERLERNGLD